MCAGGCKRDDQDSAGAVSEDVQHVAREHQGLVHIPAALVGPPDTRLVRPDHLFPPLQMPSLLHLYSWNCSCILPLLHMTQNCVSAAHANLLWDLKGHGIGAGMYFRMRLVQRRPLTAAAATLLLRAAKMRHLCRPGNSAPLLAFSFIPPSSAAVMLAFNAQKHPKSERLLLQKHGLL